MKEETQRNMSRLSIVTQNSAQKTVEGLYKDLERRITASQPGLCPVDLAASFLHICHSQSCGKCTPCRVGLGRLEDLIQQVLQGIAGEETVDLIEQTAEVIYETADCAIGQEAARMVLKGVRGFRDDYLEHIRHGRCRGLQNQPVPCVFQCPAGVDVPGYISLIHEGRYADAVRLIRKDNPFPAVCGLICEHPCEVRCRRTMVDDAINIRGLKRFACEHEGTPKPFAKAAPTGKKVAVIGGGPSGLSAAFYLSLMGHEVTVYEQRKRPGGMLRYGIPAYRLPREVLDSEIAFLQETGFVIKTGVSVGRDTSIAELRSEHDALYIGYNNRVLLRYQRGGTNQTVSLGSNVRILADRAFNTAGWAGSGQYIRDIYCPRIEYIGSSVFGMTPSARVHLSGSLMFTHYGSNYATSVPPLVAPATAYFDLP